MQNVNQLMVAITSSADDHDENTGEDNGDVALVLREALEYLEQRGQLNDFVEVLAHSAIVDIPEFEDWLKPDESYVKVENSADVAMLFTACRTRGFRQAADAIQNTGNISLVDMEAALATITDPEVYACYNRYIQSHVVCGKDADDDRIGAADGSGEDK